MKSQAKLVRDEFPAAFSSMFESLFNIYKSLSSIQQKQVMNVIEEGKKTIVDQVKTIGDTANRGVEVVSKDIKKRPALYMAGAVGLVAGLAYLGFKQSQKKSFF